MITMKDWMELVEFKITEGSEYCWQCYGPNAYTLDSWNGDHDGYSISIIFDTATQEVYETQANDYFNNRAYRMINPDYALKYSAEFANRGVERFDSDDVKYIDLEVADDFIQKALAIRSGEPYDTRVQVEVDFSDEVLLQYMKLAHERDMTFNELIEEVLRRAIFEFESGVPAKEKVQE